MKKRGNKKKVILISISVILFIVVSDFVLFGTYFASVSPIELKYVSFTEDNGIITEVKFSGPYKYNDVELTSESETIYDENGDVTQIITIYETMVNKSFIYTNEPIIVIEVSDTIDYIYQFNLDETITIKNGVIVD